MNRCLKFPSLPRAAALSLLVAGGLCGLLAPAAAQLGARPFPEDALRGSLEMTNPPDVRLNGQADRLSPGARIFQTNNLLALPGTLVGQSLTVNYVRDSAGLIHQVWILTPDEARERRRTRPAQ